MGKEYLMVARETIEQAEKLLQEDNRCTMAREFRTLLSKPSEQPYSEPVALPERKDPNASTGCYGLEEYGWNACLDEIAKLGSLFTHPAPAVHQEPVGEIVSAQDTGFRVQWSAGVWPEQVPAGTKLYTQVDPGEAERLRAEVSDLTTQRDRMREGLDNANLNIANWYKSDRALRAQVTEAQALLRDLQQYGTVDWDKLNAALSDSAEPSAKQEFREHLDKCAAEVESWPAWKREALKHPSAPVERDERAAFEADFKVRYPDAMHDIEFGKNAEGDYLMVPACFEWEGWQARAALERKP